MAGLKPEVPISTENDGEDVEVIVWDDPIWSPALSSLFDGADPKPMAALLRRGDIPPFEVLERLGIMLDRPDGYLGPWLEVKTPKRTWRRAAQALGKDRKLRKQLLEAEERAGKTEAAIADLAGTRRSRSKLFEVKKLDNAETFARTQVMLGYGPHAPKKSSPAKKDKKRGL